MAVYVGYQGAKKCTSGAQPGAQGMMQCFLAKYKRLGGKNLGIYDCRTVRGGSTTSLHGEGRAVDLGITPHGASYGTDLANRLLNNSKELGIQCIIWNREIWSGAHPKSGWRKYTGTNPHVDHLHVELSWATAKKNSTEVVKMLDKHIGSASGGSQPSPVQPPLLRIGSKGAAVRELQTLLNKFGFSVGTVDGIFGPKTESAVKKYQKARGLGVDSIVGPKTWAALRKRDQPR